MNKKTLLHSIILLCLLLCCLAVHLAAAEADKGRATVNEEIWSLETAYFTNLYKADYEGVLAIVHNRFLGWPGGLPHPINKEESGRFMRKLVPSPMPCSVRIEGGEIQALGEVVVTQYLLRVDCAEAKGGVKTQSSRITHTWVKEDGRWKLLGGMSYDQ